MLPESIGRYRVLRQLGEGGMGVVYEAEDENLGRTVAIKRIHEAGMAPPQARERLWREARSAARVNHPNLCQIYEIGEEDGDPYLVMEKLEGESLADAIARHPFAVGEAVQIVLGMLNALEAMHRRGLLHRDLKPSNVFLTEHGVKLLDFGLARLFDPASFVDPADRKLAEPITATRMLLGTPRYMPPEALRGEDLDVRADLWSVGALLFEMLSGKPPFRGQTVVEIYHEVMSGPIPALGGSAAIAAVNRVISRAMARALDDRYPSAEAMANDLRSALLAPDAGEPAQARPFTRLVVLPFRILRSDPETDYLAFALADSLTASLAGIESLVVRSTLAAERFVGEALDLRSLADEVQVDAAVTGTLLRAGDHVRVTSQLVQLPDGTALGSYAEQVSLRDLTTFEETLARRIVESLRLPLSERDRQFLGRDVAASPTAYEYYLRGTQQAHEVRHWHIARDLFQRAIDLDPSFAPAWAKLARCHYLIGKYDRDPGDNLQKAWAALDRALELNPELPMALGLRANMLTNEGRTLEALRGLIACTKRHPNDPDLYASLVIVCRFCGLLDASVAAHEQARRLDPKIRTSVGLSLAMRGEYEQALKEVRGDIANAEPLMLAMLGRQAEAVELLRAREAQDAVARTTFWARTLRLAIEGKREEALAAAQSSPEAVRDPEGIFHAARILAYVGDADRALRLLQESVDHGFFCYPVFTRDPWLDSVRGRPEFADVLRSVEKRHREAITVFFEAGGYGVPGLGGWE